MCVEWFNAIPFKLILFDFSEQHHIGAFQLNNCPIPRYSICSLEEFKLMLKINSPETKQCWSKVMLPNALEEHEESMFYEIQSPTHRVPQTILNASVPETPPKGNLIQHQTHKNGENRQRYFPSAHEITDQNELFPYLNINDKHITSVENDAVNIIPNTSKLILPRLMELTNFITTQANLEQFHSTQYSSTNCEAFKQKVNSNSQQHLSTLVCTNSHTPNNFAANALTHETSILYNQYVSEPKYIPVYQHPPEFYFQRQDLDSYGNNTGKKRRKGSGLDYSNLILLTQGSKGAHHIEICAQQQQRNINQLQSVADSQNEHSLSGKDLSGLSHEGTQPDNSVGHENSISIMENQFVNDSLVLNETHNYTRSIHQWLNDNYTVKEEELRTLNKAIEEIITMENQFQQAVENDEDARSITKSDSKLSRTSLQEVNSFPPIVSTSSMASSSSKMIDSTPTSVQETVALANTIIEKKKLYKDVLIKGIVTSPITSVENCSDSRFEELEREALEQYCPSEENLGQRFQQQLSSEERISQRFQVS